MRAADQLARHWRLITIIAETEGGATLKSLVEQTHICDRTIRRDLAVMQAAGIPLSETIGEYGRKYCSLQNGKSLLQLGLTLEKAAALYLGRQLLEPLAGTYFYHGARSAFDKLKAHVTPAVLRLIEKLAAGFYFKTHSLGDYSKKDELIDDLRRAIEDRRLTVITFQSLRTTEPVTLYDIHPYALAYHKHALYLLAFSCDHEAIRTFKVDRISAVKTERLQFTRPDDFDPAAFLAGSFGIFQGDGPPTRVRVPFAATVACILQEKQFHASQTLVSEPAGTVLATYDLSSFEESHLGCSASVPTPSSSTRRTSASRCSSSSRPVSHVTKTQHPSSPSRVPHYENLADRRGPSRNRSQTAFVDMIHSSKNRNLF